MSSRRVRAGLITSFLLASAVVQAPLNGMPTASAGDGSNGSAVVQAAAVAPGAPKIGVPKPGNRSVVAFWAAPADNGSSSITGYVIRVYRGDKLVKATSVGGPIRRATVGGLASGVTYTVNVSARSAAGTGVPSERSVAVTPLGAPGSPKIGATTKGNQAAVVRWAAPASDGGSRVTGYVVRVWRGTKLVKTVEARATARRLTVTGLTNGVPYKVTVSARNAKGIGTASARSATVTPGKASTAAPKPRASVGQANALRSAQSYIDIMPFSRAGLVGQLSYEGYFLADATYAVDNVRVNWNEEAAEAARSYLDLMGFSRAGLIDQLIYEEFTQAQAEYGANAVGLY